MISPLTLLRRHGKRDYLGEVWVTQVSHMLQAAELAAKDPDIHTDAAILSALFHDVGHLLMFEHDTTKGLMGGYGLKHHEHAGADYLRAFGLPFEVHEPVRLHVDAKRYLCAADPSYYATLTKASQVTLGYQGGPMTDQEAKNFEAHPLFENAVALRRWDDAAKVPDNAVVLDTTLDDYEVMMNKLLE